MVHNKIKAGLRDGIPIAAGYFSVSFTFGMLAVQDGISPFHAVLISLLNLTSAGQFAGITVIVSGASLLEMALTQLVINIRYALMSVSLSQKLDRSVKTFQRMLIAYGNTDEIFAVASSKPGSSYGNGNGSGIKRCILLSSCTPGDFFWIYNYYLHCGCGRDRSSFISG